MVAITDVEELKAEISIQSVTYNIEQETALITFLISVYYRGARSNRALSMEINVQEEQIEMVEELHNEKKSKLNQSIEKIKNKVSSLLRFSQRVEVDLNEISRILLEAVK